MTFFDHIELGSAPFDENDCCQVGRHHSGQMRKECQRYKKLLLEKFPTVPDGCRFKLIQGGGAASEIYFEVAIEFNPADEKCCEFAYHVESNLPSNWKDEE